MPTAKVGLPAVADRKFTDVGMVIPATNPEDVGSAVSKDTEAHPFWEMLNVECVRSKIASFKHEQFGIAISNQPTSAALVNPRGLSKLRCVKDMSRGSDRIEVRDADGI